MPRYKLTLEYDGSFFFGWQSQNKGGGVQDVVETAIKAASGQSVRLSVAGRTDSGVHACAQVAHADLVKTWDATVLARALNAHLRASGVSVRAVKQVGADFHARFGARERRYTYRILNREAPSALLRQRVWHLRRPLDVEAMSEGASYLIGTHDFTTFRASRCQARSPIRTLDAAGVSRRDDEIDLVFVARSFLHRQVRAMVGSLRLVGEGKRPPEWIKAILEKAERKSCGPSAPPWGLYLSGVRYDAPNAAADDLG